MSSEKKVRVTVEACGEVRSFECRGAALSTVNVDGSGNSCFVGSTSLGDLDARREIRDMAAELGVDADI